MKHVPIYIILVLLIVLLTCNSNGKAPNPIKEYVYTTDTIVEVDSFYYTDIVVDTFIITDTDTLIEYGRYSVNEYHYNITDSLLDGSIVIKSPFKPILDFNYKLKSYTIKDSVYVKDNSLKGFLYGGGFTISPPLNIMQVNLAYQSNRGDVVNIGFGYDFTQDNRVLTFGFLKRF